MIIAMLMTLTVTGVKRFLAFQRCKQFQSQLMTAVNMAKQRALVSDHAVTLCPARSDTAQCGQIWHKAWLIKLSGSDNVYYRLGALAGNMAISWHGGALVTDKIKVDRSGSIKTPGHFSYCPTQGQCWLSVVSQSGRVYHQRQR